MLPWTSIPIEILPVYSRSIKTVINIYKFYFIKIYYPQQNMILTTSEYPQIFFLISL